VLVAHEAFGMNDHVKQVALRLAGLGYVAFALDLYGAAGFPLDEAKARHGDMMATPGLMFGRAKAALDALAAHPSVDESRLAAIGFCQGGIVALELARHQAPIRAAIGFHPGLQRPAGSPDGAIAAKVLMMLGDADPVVSEEARAAFAASMRASGADWQLHLFGGIGHSYSNPAIDAFGYSGFAYDEAADRRSWAMTLALLAEVFAGAVH
jgi:dienelactone hydrolase